MQRVLLTILATYLVVPTVSTAQQIPQEELMNLAEQARLPLQDRHFKALVNDQLPSIPDYPKRVIKHIRGNKTNRFPTRAEITSSGVELLNKDLDRDFKKEDKSDFFSTGTYRQTELPICESTNSKKTIDSSNTQTYDILWIPEGAAIPTNIKSAFGKDTIVINKTKDVMQMSTKFNLKCLPTRIRAKGDSIFRSEGASALLNYDESDEGEISPEMFAILKDS